MTAICILTRLRFLLNVILNNVLQSLLCSATSAILYNAQQYAIMWNKAQQNVTMLSNMRHCSAMCNNAQQYTKILSNMRQCSAMLTVLSSTQHDNQTCFDLSKANSLTEMTHLQDRDCEANRGQKCKRMNKKRPKSHIVPQM